MAGPSNAPYDASAFHAFEQEGWNRAASEYAQRLAAMTAQAAGPMLDAVGAGPGALLLDIASGPGLASAAAAARGATPTGLDFSESMVKEATARFPQLTFRQGDAHHLPFPDSMFDAVICGFGLPHLAEPERAVAEMLRVLRPGGRVALTYWSMLERATGFAMAQEAVQQHGNPDLPVAPGPASNLFSDPAEFARLLSDSGFTHAKIVELQLTWKLSDPDQLFLALRDASVRTSALLKAQLPNVLPRVREAMAEKVRACRQGEEFVLPMIALMGSGTRP